MTPLLRFPSGFDRCRVLVVGDLMVDEYLWGHIERISPEAPVPVLALERRESSLGGAGNVAHNLCRLRARVTTVGVLGQDATGEQVIELLDILGVAHDLVREAGRRSCRKTRLMSLEHGQQVFRFDEESTHPVRRETEERLVAALERQMEHAQVLVFSDYAKGTLTPRVLATGLAAARRRGIPSVVGPKDSQASKYAGASVLMPNERELAQLAGVRVDGGEWLGEAAERLVRGLDLNALVITRGSRGMALFERRGSGIRRVDIPTTARAVYDVTGAGDTALATLALAIAVGMEYEAAARLANVAAGIVVGKRGTAAVTLEELAAAVDHDPQLLATQQPSTAQTEPSPC